MSSLTTVNTPQTNHRKNPYFTLAKAGLIGTLAFGAPITTLTARIDSTPQRKIEYDLRDRFSPSTVLRQAKGEGVNMGRDQKYSESAPRAEIGLHHPYTTERISLTKNTSKSSSAPYEQPKRNWLAEAEELFPGIQEFTEEEALRYEESLNKIFKPTGRNFFDL
ncbi:hypothetical protein [Paenibacillus donghaensis]|uniref:Uncharacterized protein n=1 Tax=Paenibacillus donghaensis TaxID=414771 RepID=A0A2Z2K4T5_9BACL|nr:hypothetical protein [Paenibacillus donghaensis]ASA20966.1 hypothetical protein B9T62_09310 [Paenibacillus donghaensis]